MVVAKLVTEVARTELASPHDPMLPHAPGTGSVVRQRMAC
jgi:hypothetical protein